MFDDIIAMAFPLGRKVTKLLDFLNPVKKKGVRIKMSGGGGSQTEDTKVSR